MDSNPTKGNNPELWETLLKALDEKLQLGLLDRMRRVAHYHFEGDTLFIEPATEEEAAYLSKDSVFHHLELLAQDAVGVEKVKITKIQKA